MVLSFFSYYFIPYIFSLLYRVFFILSSEFGFLSSFLAFCKVLFLLINVSSFGMIFCMVLDWFNSRKK